jgi:hypothetical protein
MSKDLIVKNEKGLNEPRTKLSFQEIDRASDYLADVIGYLNYILGVTSENWEQGVQASLDKIETAQKILLRGTEFNAEKVGSPLPEVPEE